MKTCKNCNVNLKTSRNTCPLCHSVLINDGKEESYQEYPEYIQTPNYRKLVIKILLFATFLAVFASVLINILTNDKEHTRYWSTIVIGGILFVWVLVGVTIISKRNLVFKFILQGATIGILFYTIELNTSLKEGWSFIYVIPFLIIGVTLVSTILSLCIPKKAASFSVYILLLSVLGLFPLIYVWVKDLKPLWPSIACCAYSVFTFLALIFFGGKPLLSEIKKKMYI